MSKKGFTAVELLVVVFVVGVIALGALMFSNKLKRDGTPNAQPGELATPTLSPTLGPTVEPTMTDENPTATPTEAASPLDGQDILLNELLPANIPSVEPFNIRVIIASDGEFQSIYLGDENLTPSSIILIFQKIDESQTSGASISSEVHQNGEFLVVSYSGVDQGNLVIFKTDGEIITTSVLGVNSELQSSRGNVYYLVSYLDFPARENMQVRLANILGDVATANIDLNTGEVKTDTLVEL
ncbi:prepilin-type N-terminal cleavage/methylation domain-containing protein [candidate division WWE3 bacterium]|uniref:Prepilin-type N-terminal cleavage/methylation domain-containing protein n=1 Tax=candidate division WWE3 bacterium TaxID=2053526 RepID=A0A955RQE7_UNCKA|nr:prepilin-type N-terminal cleavage/methylation domain-containing protein [candidate division WWE3 bacterium]